MKHCPLLFSSVLPKRHFDRDSSAPHLTAARHSCCAEQHGGLSSPPSLVPVCALLKRAHRAFAARRGGSLFPTFMGFLQAQGGEQGEKEQELVAQLREVNDALGQSDGPFLVRGLGAAGPALCGRPCQTMDARQACVSPLCSARGGRKERRLVLCHAASACMLHADARHD